MNTTHDDSLNSTQKPQAAPKARHRWVWLVLAGLTVGSLAASALATYGLKGDAVYADAAADSASAAAVKATIPRRVAARGRLEPAGGVIRIAGPAARQPAVVAELKVGEGDWIEKGQVIAILDGVPALTATVQRLEALARNAQAEMRRFAGLCRDGIASGTECDAVRMRLETAQADVARARADLDTSFVRAPQAGRILGVHAHAGERVDSLGIVEMGDTRVMDVVAEIYETDAPLLRRGQLASISAAVLPEALPGSVERVGVTISKQSVFDVDPAANTDSRIVEARIRVSDAGIVSALTNLQVDVEIEIEQAGVTS